ncbi:hypothetical protein [Xanthomonas sp. XNM01]|uniref:hypothetical protein n=1 Tax=Xanthomonas sp. XNM01 TaxID=2769289 RepID=UPI00177EBF8B|nr:hypothetical protein [Xanthomonas sp. XNM01]MBD9369990.1 hypothetical protein [Xanthomonas sp. XNM01]
MRISPAQAALLTARERQLLETTGPYEVKQLVTLIKRTRELRDKQRDLAQRHRIAATQRSQSKASAVVARTLKKEALFERALLHYEAQLEKINRECSSAMSELRIGTSTRKTARTSRTTKTGTARKASKATKTTRAKTAAKARSGTTTKAVSKARQRRAGKAEARTQAAFR